MLMPMSTRHWAFQLTEDDRCGRECNPPTAESYARTIVRLEVTINAYTRVIERVNDDDDQPCQTARWSGGHHRLHLAP
jgi:hypothetical protein